MSDTASHGAPQPDPDELRHTLSIHDVERELVAAGVPRSHRQVIRYCETGMLEAVKVPGPTGDQWYVSPASVPKVIGDLKQWDAQRASRTTPQPATSAHDVPGKTTIQGNDMPGPSAPQHAAPESKNKEPVGETQYVTSGYVSQLEKRIDEKDDVISLLKGQLVSKDEQIKEMSTRYRETHTLLGAMQRMFAPLLGQRDPYKVDATTEPLQD